MKKAILNILRVVIIFCVLSAALTTYNLNFKGFNDNESNNANTKKELPHYNIIWYHANPPQRDTALVFEEVNRYLNKKINASVEIRLADLEEYDKNLKAVIASKEKFDICFTSVWMNSYVHNSQKGSFIELDALLEKHGRTTKSILPRVLLDASRVNGKLYGLPVNKQLAHQWAISFNKKYIDKYEFNLSKVKKLEDIESMLEIISEEEPEVVPYLVCKYISHAYTLPMERIDEQTPSALYFDNRTNYTLINTFESTEFKEYLSLMRRWYNNGYILEDAASINNVDYHFNSGNWFAGVISYNPSTEAMFSNLKGYDIVAVPLDIPFVTKKDIIYHMQAISSTSENPERAMMFLELLNTDKYLYNLIAYGLEGIHYVKNSENVITAIDRSYGISPYSFGNRLLSYQLSFEPNTIDQDNKRFDDNAIISPLVNFTFNPEPVKDEIAKITEVTEELEGPLFVGSVDPEIYLPKVIAKYKAAGLDKVMEEQQRQLDNWRRNKR